MTNKKVGLDKKHQDIGKSKYRVRQHYTTWVEYDVIANSKEEAQDAVREHGGLERVEWEEGYYKDDPVEVYCSDWNHDSEGDSDYEKYRGPCVKKVEECVPYEEQDIDTNEWIDNYEDPEWTSDEYRWTKEECAENAEKVQSTKDEIPF